ncbi:MAG: CsgG/HfaB family protein [Pyrinomonadaceae bacterium]
MKNLSIAFVLGIALAGLTIAQAPSKGAANRTKKVRIAVVEFTPGPNASVMTAEAKRQLQASLAFALVESDLFDVVDVRNTRSATQASLEAINGGTSTSAAVKAGKHLSVSYVLTGVVSEYDTSGSATLKARLVEVATGKVKYTGATSQQAAGTMRSGGAAEMQTKVLKPLIRKLTDSLTAVF